jgi:hypothetical protein
MELALNETFWPHVIRHPRQADTKSGQVGRRVALGELVHGESMREKSEQGRRTSKNGKDA